MKMLEDSGCWVKIRRRRFDGSLKNVEDKLREGRKECLC